MSHNRHPIRHSRHFIPCDQEGALVWVQNFVAFVRENREALGFEESRIEEAARALAEYEAAYEAGTNPTTRTMTAVPLKNELRHEAERTPRLRVPHRKVRSFDVFRLRHSRSRHPLEDGTGRLRAGTALTAHAKRD